MYSIVYENYSLRPIHQLNLAYPNKYDILANMPEDAYKAQVYHNGKRYTTIYNNRKDYA